MHITAYETSKLFFNTYCTTGELRVVDIGSFDVNGSMRSTITPNVIEYVGVDFAEGKGVDVVLTDPYKYPLEDKSFDVLVTSSCFEHSEMFWLSFLEGMRVLKDDGIMYCNVPSAWMMYHRFPVDCWRFYPDAAKAFETWARYNNIDSMVLESYVCPPGKGEFVSDLVFVILKDRKYLSKYPTRMIDSLQSRNHFYNGFRFPPTEQYPDGWTKPIGEMKQDMLFVTEKGLAIR